MILGLAGPAGSGKDAIGKILVEERGFTRLAFADALRGHLLTLDPLVDGEFGYRLQEVVQAYGWDNAKRLYPEVRRLLQVYGTEVVRDKVSENFWVNRVFEQIRISATMGNSDKDYVITDVRFPNEVKALFYQPTASYLIHVRRPGLEPVNPHVSEEALGGISYERMGFAFHFYNGYDSLEALKVAVLKMHDGLLRLRGIQP